jgi:hypothetical protein
MVECRYHPANTTPPSTLRAYSLAGVPLLPGLPSQGLPGPGGHFFMECLVPGEKRGHVSQKEDESHGAKSQSSEHPQHLQEGMSLQGSRIARQPSGTETEAV